MPRRGPENPTRTSLRPLVEWLKAQPWADVVMAGRSDLAALPGVLPLALLWGGSLNERRPLLAVSPVWSDAPNEYGVCGTVQSLTTQAALRSSHDSLSPNDLHAVLVANGPTFQQGRRTTLPTGAIDLTPTVLACLGYPPPPSAQGRVLWEMWAQPEGEPGKARDELVIPTAPRRLPLLGAAQGQAVKLHHVDKSTYIHGSLPMNPA